MEKVLFYLVSAVWFFLLFHQFKALVWVTQFRHSGWNSMATVVEREDGHGPRKLLELELKGKHFAGLPLCGSTLKKYEVGQQVEVRCIADHTARGIIIKRPFPEGRHLLRLAAVFVVGVIPFSVLLQKVF